MAAARSLVVVDKPPSLPLRPGERAEVIAAALLVERAASEVERARLAVAGGEAALAAHREHAASRLLEALEAGTDAVDPAGAAHLQVLEQARQRLATAEPAAALAKVRHDRVLAAARHEFTSEIRPLLLQAIEHTAELLAPAVAANAELARLATYAHDEGAGVGFAYELRLPLPGADRLVELVADRRRLFVAPVPPADVVVVKLLARHGNLMAGETCGLPPDEAKLLCLAIYGTCVDPEDAKRLGVANAMRFDRPTRLKLKRDLQRAEGIFSVAGSVHEFDSVEASRLVNLGFGEEVK